MKGTGDVKLIGGKTPDEIKKALKYCTTNWKMRLGTCDKRCPYGGYEGLCNGGLNYDLLTYIERLERENKELEAKLSVDWREQHG